MSIRRISLRARPELAFSVNRHEPEMVGAERMQHEECAARGGIGQRFGGSALSFHGVSGRLAIHQREPTVFLYAEAGDRIVATIGGEQKLAIRRKDDATCTLEGVRRAR